MLTKTDKKNAIWNSLSFIGTSLLGFFNFTINYKTFSSEDFGLFILINALFGIGGTLDFGFGVSTVKYISEAKKKNDNLLVNEIFVSFFWSFFILSLVIIALYLSYLFIFFSNSAIYSSNNSQLIDKIFYILLISFFFRYMNNYLGKLFEGFAEFVLFSKLNLIVAAFNTLLMIVVFISKLSIEYLAYVYLITGIINFITLLTISLKKLGGLSFNLKYFNLKIIKEYALYSLNIQLSFFINSFIDPIIKYILGRYFTLSVVTYFESAKKIIDLSSGLIFSAQKGLLNKLSEQNAVKKLSEYINENIYIYSKMSNYYSFLIYGILNVFLCLFIFFWFKSYDAMIMFLIFVLPYSLINFAGCLYLILMVEGKGIKLLLLQTINFILVTSLLFLSVNIFNNYLGILGFYLAIIITIFLIIHFLKKYNGFSVKAFLRKTAIGDLILLNILIISELILLYFFQNSSYLILAGYFVTFNVFYYKYTAYFGKVIFEKFKYLKVYLNE
jgi:O-antigen/teichoic acid export membrane protein